MVNIPGNDAPRLRGSGLGAFVSTPGREERFFRPTPMGGQTLTNVAARRPDPVTSFLPRAPWQACTSWRQFGQLRHPR